MRDPEIINDGRKKVKTTVQGLLHSAGISINGEHPWDIVVHNDKFYKRLLSNPELSLAETYMEGLWDCVRLDQFFSKLLSVRLDVKIRNNPRFWLLYLRHRLSAMAFRIFNFQTQEKSFEVGHKHYDIGNDLYQAMLDKRMVYTCAYWENGASNLDEAQEEKLHLTCQKLDLKPGMTVLDIGCGFGSFAKFAAEHYGVTVTGNTISRQQYEYAKKSCSELPVEIRFQDYRDLLQDQKKYDRIVSLGMFEHVGYKNYATYMKVASHCLKEDGIFLLHTIGGNASQVTCSSQFINQYIFPNGNIPSIAQIGKSIERKFVMEDWHNFGVNYDKTLMAWHHNFNRHWDSQLRENYDERFRRMWNYYLLSCAASFRTRQNQLWQLVLTTKGLSQGFAFNRYDYEALPKSSCRQAS